MENPIFCFARETKLEKIDWWLEWRDAISFESLEGSFEKQKETFHIIDK